MNTVAIKKIVVLVAAGCLFTVVPGCHKETEQDKIKKVITSVQQAAEEKDVRKIISSLSKTYQDPQGFDYDSIKGLLMGYFFRHQKVHVYIPDIVITVEGASAQAEFQAVLTGGHTGSAADILPESLGMYAFAVSFRKEDNEWKIVSAQWNRVGEGKE
jgi:ketosteroid isomerase-like protein